MTIEKQAESADLDVRVLVKTAADAEKIIVYDLDELGLPAVAIIATGPRAAAVRSFFKELSND